MIWPKQRIFYTFLLIWLTVVFVFSTAPPLYADQAGKPIPPSADQASPQWPHLGSDLKPDPALKFGSLPNGFRYVLMKNNTPKDRVSMHLYIQAGSLYETDAQQGLAHYLEHMQFNGSTHFPPGELVKYFQRIGMDFGPDANASTGFDRTVYDILLPTGDEKSVAEGLTVMQDFAEGALLQESEVDRERNVILAEKRSRDSANYRTFVASLQFEMPETLVPKRLPIGTQKTIENADRALLKKFYDVWYRPDRMVLVMVGDFDIPSTKAMIQKRFGAMKARAAAKPEPELGPVHYEGIQTFYHEEPETGSTEINIQVIRKRPHERDSLALQQREMVDELANTILQHRLDRLLRQPEAPFTSVSVGVGLFLKEIFYGYISADCNDDKWAATLAQMEQSLRQALTYGFTAAELARVKKEYIAELEKAENEAGTRKSSVLARQIIHHINVDRVMQSPKQAREQFASFINDLGIDDVNDAFRRIWQPSHRLVSVTGNAKIDGGGGTPEQAILNTFEKSSEIAVAKPKQNEILSFPYLPEPDTEGKIIRRKEVSDLGILQIDFENGLRLNLKKTDFKADEVVAKLILGPGRSQEPEDKPGLAELAEAVINESGLGKMDREALNAALAGTHTIVRFSTGDAYSLLTAKSVTQEMPLLFQLLYAQVTDPACREDAFQLSMERFKQNYEAMSSRVESAMTLKGNRFLAGGDSRFGMPDPDVFQKLRIEDVRLWMERIFDRGSVELSIAGDFDPKEVVALAARYLGTLPLEKAKQPSDRPDAIVFPAGGQLNIDVDTRISKAQLHIAFPTDDIWNIRQTRRLAALGSVFTDRLREEIREKMGDTYSAYAYNAPSRAYPGYGLFNVGITVAPSRIEPVLTKVRQMVDQLDTDGITKDEFQRALEPTLTGIKDMRRENGYWLTTVMTGSSLHPEQIEWSRTIEADYAAITPEEVMAVTRKYLKNEKAAVVIVQPEKRSAPDAGASSKKG